MAFWVSHGHFSSVTRDFRSFFYMMPLATFQPSFIVRCVVLLLLFLTPFCSLQAQTLEVKENQLVILKMPNGTYKVQRAKQVEVKELVVMVMDSDGKRGAVQKSLVVLMIDLRDPALEKLDKVQVEEMLAGYEKAMTDFPASQEILQEEVRKWKKVIEDEALQAAEKESNQAKALENSTREIFDTNKDYTREELAAVIDPALLAIQQYPDLGEKIREYLNPWTQRMDYLKEGRKLFEGQWLTGQEIRLIQEERVSIEQEKHFKEKAKLSFSSLILPQTSVLITILIAAGTLLSVFFSFFHLATARGGNLTFGGALTLLLGLAILGAYGFYTYKMLNFTADLNEYWAESHKLDVPEDQVPNPLPRMLFMASGSTIRNITPQDAKVSLTDRQINVLMKKYLKLERKSVVELLDMERIQTVVKFQSDRIEFIDEAICLGQKVLIRYELFYKSEANSFSIYNQEVYVGGAKLPASLASFMFRQFFRNLQDCLNETNLPKIYSIEKIEEGKVHLIWPITLASPSAKKEPSVTSPATEAAPAADAVGTP